MTDADRIEELEKENEELRKELEESEKECGKHEDEIDKLEKEIEGLEETIDELENATDTTPFVAVLDRLADHRNWTDDKRYAPIMHELDDHPADVAGRVLREN